MNMEYASLEVSELRALYLQKTHELSQALLFGKEWKDLKQQRDEVTTLAIFLHKRIAETGKVSPADFQIRKEDNKETLL